MEGGQANGESTARGACGLRIRSLRDEESIFPREKKWERGGTVLKETPPLVTFPSVRPSLPYRFRASGRPTRRSDQDDCS